MALRHIKTKRSLKDENKHLHSLVKHLHSLVKHLQIELENARLDISIKNDAINGYKSENARLRQRINSMYAYDVFGEEV